MTEVILKTAAGQPIELLHRIAAGGEGVIWQTNIPQLLAKIYHNPTDQLQEKIEGMIKNPPINPLATPDHISIAWPSQEIYDEKNHFKGFLMPRISGSLTLNHIYNPKLRKKFAPGFNWFYLHTTAMNIAAIIQSLHQRGYVIGDIKTDNFLVNDQAMVSCIDTDSFQIQIESQTFLATMGSEGFTPPELIGKNFNEIQRMPIHDHFGLAVLIHLLLTGYHPFSGEWVESQDPELPINRDALIQQGMWPYDGKGHMKPSPFAMPYDVFVPEIRQAFLQTFTEGHQDPQKRLSAKDWYDVLQYALRQLTVCDQNPNHYHDQHQPCFWCDRKNTTGLDVFPGMTLGEKEYVLQHFTRALQSKDMKAISDMWHQHIFLHQDPRLKMHHAFIQRACDYRIALDQFIEVCESDVPTDQILEWWSHDERLTYFPPDPTIEIKGQNLTTFLHILQEKHQSLQDLRASVQRANGLSTVDEDHEKSIVHQFHRTPWSEDIRLKEKTLFERAYLAEKRMMALQKFRHYFLEKNEAAVADLLKTQDQYLMPFTLTASQKNFITSSLFLRDIYEKILNVWDQGPCQESFMLSLWDEHPQLGTSTFGKKYYLEDGKNITLADKIDRIRNRLKLQNHLKDLVYQKDYITIANLWDNANVHEKDIFDTYQSHIDQGKHKKKIWMHLKRAALENELHHHILDWDETNFYPLAQQEKLQAVLQDAFVTAYSPIKFPSNNTVQTSSQIVSHRELMEIQWPWPQAKWHVPICMWAVRSDRFPTSYDDVDQPFHCGWTRYEKPQDMGKIFVPFQREKVFASIWPAHFICQKPVVLGSPLHIEQRPFHQVHYEYSIKKSFFNKSNITVNIKFFNSNSIEIPPLVIYGNLDYPPIVSDGKKVRLGALQSFHISDKSSRKKYTEFKIKMPVLSKIDINRPFYIRLYPANMDVSNSNILLMPPLDVQYHVKK